MPSSEVHFVGPASPRPMDNPHKQVWETAEKHWAQAIELLKNIDPDVYLHVAKELNSVCSLLGMFKPDDVQYGFKELPELPTTRIRSSATVASSQLTAQPPIVVAHAVNSQDHQQSWPRASSQLSKKRPSVEVGTLGEPAASLQKRLRLGSETGLVTIEDRVGTQGGHDSHASSHPRPSHHNELQRPLHSEHQINANRNDGPAHDNHVPDDLAETATQDRLEPNSHEMRSGHGLTPGSNEVQEVVKELQAEAGPHLSSIGQRTQQRSESEERRREAKNESSRRSKENKKRIAQRLPPKPRPFRFVPYKGPSSGNTPTPSVTTVGQPPSQSFERQHHVAPRSFMDLAQNHLNTLPFRVAPDHEPAASKATEYPPVQHVSVSEVATNAVFTERISGPDEHQTGHGIQANSGISRDIIANFSPTEMEEFVSVCNRYIPPALVNKISKDICPRFGNSSDTTGAPADLSQIGSSLADGRGVIMEPSEHVSDVMASSQQAAQPQPTVTSSHQQVPPAAESNNSAARNIRQGRQGETMDLLSNVAAQNQETQTSNKPEHDSTNLTTDQPRRRESIEGSLSSAQKRFVHYLDDVDPELRRIILSFKPSDDLNEAADMDSSTEGQKR